MISRSGNGQEQATIFIKGIQQASSAYKCPQGEYLIITPLRSFTSKQDANIENESVCLKTFIL